MSYRLARLRAVLSALLISLSLGLAGPAAAADEETIARNFLLFLNADKQIVSSEAMAASRLDPALAPVTVGTLFTLGGGGYIFVSADRSISPVKAYSLSSEFTALPETYRNALLAELELRVRVAAAAAAGRTSLSLETSETQRQWDFLLTFDPARQPLAAYTAGDYLVKTNWNQGYPYNKYLPAVGGQTVVAGCVNVAVAQVMRYYGKPDSGRGVVSYTWKPASQSAEVLKTILYRNYNWANMPATLDATTPDYQSDEVALLLRDLGIANRTAFDVTGSSTSLNASALLENFGYSTALAHMDNTNFAGAGGFLETLKGEIASGRPVLLTFPTHMVVADGYRSEATGESVHINMGWGGTADNFYFLNAPVQYDTTNSFPTNAGDLEIYHHFKPCSKEDGDCYVNLEAGDGASGLSIAGSFNGAGDADVYELYLKGPTMIQGSRGYGNLAFFLSVTAAADGSSVFTVADPDTAQSAQSYTVGSSGTGLPAGKYLVRISLCDETGTNCYDADAMQTYTVTLTSTALTAEEKAAVDAALDKAPVIGNSFPDLLLNTAAGTRKLLIDARDENGDAVQLQAVSSNPAAVTAGLTGNVLSLTPAGAAKAASRITVTATANGKAVEKSFTVLTDDAATAFGKSFTVGGLFASSTDLQSHQMILDGACTITGSRPGSSNQAFFTSLFNAANQEIGTADGAEVPTGTSSLGHSVISGSFLRAIYRLDATLCKAVGGGTNCYPFDSAADKGYTLQVSCPDADVSTATIAGLLGISLNGSAMPGDVDGSGIVTLADAILSLQILSGQDTSAKTVRSAAEVNGDQKIGPAEPVYILQKAAGLRN